MAKLLPNLCALTAGLVVTISHAVAENYSFEVHEGFRDIYCSDHSTGVGTVKSQLVCGHRCSLFTECRGFFYNSVNKTCALVKIISVPYSGCRQETGSTYYIMLMPGVFACYGYTSDDYSRLTNLEPEYSVCTSYKYHTFHSDVGTSAQYGCGTCHCCETRGCYSGLFHLYNGTWSTTASGRVCQRWDQQTPHIHDRHLGEFPPGETYITANNYCRDPDKAGYLWCYTMDSDMRFEDCGIPTC